MSSCGGKGKIADIKPGDVRAHITLIEPKISARFVSRRGVSIVWLTPKEARDFGSKLICAAERCVKPKNIE